MERQKVKWTPEEDRSLMLSINAKKPVYPQIVAYAAKRNRTAASYATRYYILSKRETELKNLRIEPSKPTVKKKAVKRAKARLYSTEEDNTILRYIKAHPQNLKFCFMTVAEQIGRSSESVRKHWYNKLSRQHDVKAYILASESSVIVNRKCSPGVDSTPSVWKKIIAIINRILP